jgi:hypothetical protein
MIMIRNYASYEDKEEIIPRKESFNQFGWKEDSILLDLYRIEQDILSCMIWKENNN